MYHITKVRIALVMSILTFLIFLTLKTLVFTGLYPSTADIRLVEFLSFAIFSSLAFYLYRNTVSKKDLELKNRMDAINKSNAVIEFDTDGIICFANEEFLKSMGYAESEIIGKHHRIFVLPEERESDKYKEFWEILKSGEFFEGEFIRVKKDGSLVHLNATYNPIKTSEGKVYRILKLANDTTELYLKRKEIQKQNTYLEHAAKILRHDMHSGINTYIPRGISSLERRLTEDSIRELKIEAPLKMIKEGLRHTQKVYKGVYEFTNLVKKGAKLEKNESDLRYILEDYLSSTAYKSQVIISDLGNFEVNESLFCTAIDNLIRNGLRYNDSNSKEIRIKRSGDYLLVEDNGRGMSSEDFKRLSQPYVRKEGQVETGSGLGLNICKAILEEHGFSIDSSILSEGGTQIKIKLTR